MQCLNPMLLERPGCPSMVVPCGHCVKCKQMRQSMWAMRLMHELETTEDATFATLTYNDRWLPSDGQLHKEDAQLFIKRLRARVAPVRIKYYLCGEYGALRGRPHYHAILYGIDQRYQNIIEKEWAMGFVTCRPVNERACRYVAKYVLKQALGDIRRYREVTGRQEPYQCCSRGLGLSWLMARADRIGSQGLSRHGRKIPLPRYYIKQLKQRGLLSDRVTEDVKVDNLSRQYDLLRALERDGVTYQQWLATRAEEVKTLMQMHKMEDLEGQ